MAVRVILAPNPRRSLHAPPADLVSWGSVWLYVFSGAMYQPTRLSATVYALANAAMVHAGENIV